MLTTFIRTIIMYTVVVVALRLMGKRQLSDFEPSELVVTIMISEIAAMPVQDNAQPLLSSVLVIALLLIFEIVLSFAAYKSARLRKTLYGTPSVFYEKGKLNEAEMEKQRFNVTDLMEAVRNSGICSLSEVDYVIMETNGNISVIPSAAQSPPTAADLKISTPKKLISYVIVDNGKIYGENLKRLGYDKNWLDIQLKRKNIKKFSEVFFMSADKEENITVIKKQKR